MVKEREEEQKLKNKEIDFMLDVAISKQCDWYVSEVYFSFLFVKFQNNLNPAEYRM